MLRRTKQSDKVSRRHIGFPPNLRSSVGWLFIGDNVMKTCRRCNIEKPIAEYDKHKDYKDGHLNICKSCNKITRYKRQSLPEVKAHLTKTRKERVDKLKKQGICVACAKNLIAKNKTLCFECSQKTKIRMFHQRNKLRETVFSHYGEAKCIICGESRKLCLTIDHTNNDGAKHRKAIGGGGYNTYCWLKRNNYPKGFQVLCRNCNWIKHAELFYGEKKC